MGASKIRSEIDEYVKSSRFRLGWKKLLALLSLADSEDSIVKTAWLDHVTGRVGDNGRVFRQETVPGFLFWPSMREVLNTHELSGLFDELEADQEIIEAAANRIFGAEFKSNEAAATTSKAGAVALLRGAFSAAKTALQFSLTQQWIQHEYDGTKTAHQTRIFEDAQLLWASFRETIAAYEEFWGEVENLPEAIPEKFRDAEEISSGIRDVQILDHFSIAAHQLRETGGGGIHMARRAVRWLLGRQNGDVSKSHEIWVPLVAGVGKRFLGTCAKIRITTCEGGPQFALAWPDPVYHGILPLDLTFRASFDDAVESLHTHFSFNSHLRSYSWAFEYLDPDSAARIAESYGENEDWFRRQLMVTGGSASLAFACGLHLAENAGPSLPPVTASAIVSDEDGSLQPVAGIRDKLCKDVCDNRFTQVILSADDTDSLEGVDLNIHRHATLKSAITSFHSATRPLQKNSSGVAIRFVAAALLGVVGWLLMNSAADETTHLEPINAQLSVNVLPRDEDLSVDLSHVNLPLSPGDAVEFFAESQAPSYFYLFWLDADGRVTPVWPWKNFSWNELPSVTLRTSIRFPEALEYFVLQPDTEGIHAIVLVGSSTLISNINTIRTSLEDLAYQQTDLPTAFSKLLVRIEDGKIVTTDDRFPIDPLLKRSANHPVLQLEDCIRRKLMPLGVSVDAICFAFGERYE